MATILAQKLAQAQEVNDAVLEFPQKESSHFLPAFFLRKLKLKAILTNIVLCFYNN